MLIAIIENKDKTYEYLYEVNNKLISYHIDKHGFSNSNLDYLNNYLVKKRQEAVSNQNTNVRRKTLATDIGRSFVNDDNAYVKVLFIPTLITFTYLLGLFMYTFIFK